MAEMLKLGRTRLKRIMAIVRKEISGLITDKVALLILFVIPVIMISIVGGSKPRSDLASCTIWVIDEDNTNTSRAFVTTMRNQSLLGDIASSSKIYGTGEYAPVEPKLGQENATDIVNLENANKTLPTEYLDAYIVLPKGFEEQLARDGKTTVYVFYDSIDFTTMLISDVVILGGLTEVQLNNLLFERDVYFFPEFRPRDITQNFNLLELAAPIFIGLMLYFSINLIATQCIVGDVPLQRLLTTPVYRSEVIMGKILSYWIISVFQIILSLILLEVFRVNMVSLWIDLFILFMLNSLASISMGVFISTISKTRLQASQLFLMFFFVMLILTYYVRSPIFMYFNPIEQTRIAFSNLAFRGASLEDVYLNLIYIGLTALLYFTASVVYIKYFKKEFL